jgi:hypothetical protein
MQKYERMNLLGPFFPPKIPGAFIKEKLYTVRD